jgi:hypothetical protein
MSDSEGDNEVTYSDNEGYEKAAVRGSLYLNRIEQI